MFITKNYMTEGGDKLVIGGNLTFEEGSTITGGTLVALTPATASELGSVKVGDGLVITDAGVLSVAGAANQAASTATTIEGLVSDFNAMLTKLKAAGLMAADSETT